MTQYSHNRPPMPGVQTRSVPLRSIPSPLGQLFFGILFACSVSILIFDSLSGGRSVEDSLPSASDPSSAPAAPNDSEERPDAPTAPPEAASTSGTISALHYETVEMEMRLQAKLMIAAKAMAQESGAGSALFESVMGPEILSNMAGAPSERDDAFLLRRLLTLAGHFGYEEAARSFADRLEQAQNQAPSQLEFNGLLRKLYVDRPATPLTDKEIEQAQVMFRWFGRIVEIDSLRLTDPVAADSLYQTLIDESSQTLLRLGLIALLGMILFPVGVVLAAIFLGKVRSGSWRWRGPFRTVRPWLCFETFTLYIASGALLTVGLWSGLSEDLMGALSFLWSLGAPLLLIWIIFRGDSPSNLRKGIGLTADRGWFREIGAGMVAYMATLPFLVLAAMVTAVLSGWMGAEPGEGAHPIISGMGEEASPWSIVFLLIFAVIVAPITEELFFRGLLYSWLRTVGGVVFAAFWSGLLFASIHPQGLLGIPILTVLGVAFALAREWRGSLIAPMVMHAMINGGTMLLILGMR